MAYPLTPTIKSDAGYGTNDYGTRIRNYAFFRSGYNQPAPYNVDTVMDLVVYTSSGFKAGAHAGNDITAAKTEATNLARKRFVDEIGQSSSFGATMTAELRATWGTVVDGVTTTLRAARAVKRGQLVEAGRILGFTPPVITKTVVVRRRRRKGGGYTKKTVRREYWRMPTGREVAKDLANRWLWFSYGIKPLVSDIHNGMDVLTREVPIFHDVKGSGKAVRSANWSPDPGWIWNTSQSTVRVKITAQVTVINPNLWLANQLGLVNPVQMFNEGIPFSFVVDWFSNLSQMIMQMTDFVGLRIDKPITIYRSTARHTMVTRQLNWWVKEERYSRSLEIPKARLVFAYERFEWQRGANAISLLIGLLRKV